MLSPKKRFKSVGEMAGDLAGKSHLCGCKVHTACDFLGEVEGSGKALVSLKTLGVRTMPY